MSGPTRPPSTGAPLQLWHPDQGAGGVTCPGCGLANEPGARVCRNCGLPIASSTDPLRGVSAGRVEMPGAQRSGLSAMVGLALVVGLLLVAGTLAVSGGGILNSGGRFGVSPLGSGSPDPGVDVALRTEDPALPLPTADGGTQPASTEELTNVLATTCAPESGAIRDANKAKWRVNRVTAGARLDEGNDRITWELDRTAKGKKATHVELEWMDIKAAKEAFELAQLSGQRAIVITFDGPVDIIVDQRIDAAALEVEGVSAMRGVQLFVGDDGKVRTVVGTRGEGCVTMSAPLWKQARNKTTKSKVFLDIERP